MTSPSLPNAKEQTMESAPTVHRLKVWVEYIPDLISGAKTFEARKDDRAFRVGDVLELFGWDRHANEATGWEQRRAITYKLSGPAWGVESGHCILGLSPVPSPSQAVMVSDGIMTAARQVCLFDWSGNDADAVAAVERLRAALNDGTVTDVAKDGGA